MSANVMRSFPYPVQIHALDGASVWVNKAMLVEFRASCPDMVVGKYNVFEDPSVVASGQIQIVKRALDGETVALSDIKLPEGISQMCGARDFDLETVYQDVTVFPIPDGAGRVPCFAAVSVNRRVYGGKDEVEKVKAYIDDHCLERFDANEAAKVACLSRAHTARLFKKHTGITPYQYHVDRKIRRLKAKLLDPNLSVAKAFAACNMFHSGRSARLFREKVGVSPSAFRRLRRAAPSGTSQPIIGEQELLAQVFEAFPYPLQVFSVDGTARLANDAAPRTLGIKSRESHLGNYNIFQDPTLQELGAADRLRQVLRGEIVHLPDLNAPYMDITRPFDVYDSDIRTILADITCFPLLSDEGAVECFAAVFIVKEIRRGSEGVALGKQYMETHWQEPFDAGETARAACLSKGHFARMFKKHTGITPHEYHSNYRIGKLKEKLLDHNLSIAEAFAACNIRYNGHAAGVFREKVGVAPSEFRRAARHNNSSRSNRTKNDIFATNCAHI